MAAGFLDLEAHFVFYGSYHRNKWNMAIHLATIWVNVTATLVFLQYLPEMMPTPGWMAALFGDAVKVNLPLMLAIVYGFIYVYMEPRVGSIGEALESSYTATGVPQKIKYVFSIFHYPRR